MNLTPEPALPLNVAELLLAFAIRTRVTVRSPNADALAILNVLGPRQEFPSITDAALHHMLWISLDSIAHAGDTQLLGRLLDPTLPKPSPPIRTLRSSPHVLARASEVGHLDFLGYWLRLARRYESVPLTLTMVRRAISAAVRADRMDVFEWWVDAMPKLFLTFELSMCWRAAYEAAGSVSVLEHIKQLRMVDVDCHQRGPLVQFRLEDNVLAGSGTIAKAIMRAHGAGNVGVIEWWFTQVPRLGKVRFLLPHMLTWSRHHFADNLDYLCANDMSQRRGACLGLCWMQYPSTHLLFEDVHVWKAHAPDLLADILEKTTCPRCQNKIHNTSQFCPIQECTQDHCTKCAIPVPTDGGLFAGLGYSKSNLATAMCKHGVVEGFRALLRSGPDALAHVHRQALHVASKHGHVGILKVWLEEYQGEADGFQTYGLWGGIGIEILDWLLEHDVDRRLLRWMSMDEASRAGQTRTLDWWMDRFREGRVPVLRFSNKALHFKSYESGIKSLRWWLRSGLLFDQGKSITVSVWRHCYYEHFELVEMLVVGGVSVCFQPMMQPLPPAWPDLPREAEVVIAGIRRWWERARMATKFGTQRAHTGLDECLQHAESMYALCNWSREIVKGEGLGW